MRRHFPILVREREAETRYALSSWLQQAPEPPPSDWLIAAFDAAPGPTLGGKSRRSRMF
ncbi:MAG TPA: hypothetical protein VFF73_12060 [Planctomycetota bacterium]|nr:hypothetical protein [Planctomycetota bacterium]